MLSWVLGESSGPFLNKLISVEENLVRALSGGKPPKDNWDPTKVTKEIEGLEEQIS
ncbi:unnamed protein product, partial [marine sediment metagenome]